MTPAIHDRHAVHPAVDVASFAAVVIAPSVAHAHDATILAIAAGPPLVLAPFATAVLRRAWLRGTHRAAPPWSRFIAISVLELVLWLAVAWLAALVYFQEAWLAGALLCGALAAIIALHHYLMGERGPWSERVVCAGFFPGVWLVLQLASWALVLALE